MKIDDNKLRASGWSSEEINKTASIIKKLESLKHPHAGLMNKIIFITTIIIIIVSLVILSIITTPLLIVFDNFRLYLIIMFIALSFGLLLTHFISDIDHFKLKHHAIISMVIPLTAIMSSMIIVNETNKLVFLGAVNHNPVLPGIVFTISFMIPYIIYLWGLK